MAQVVKTVLQKKYTIMTASNVFDAAATIKSKPEVKIVLVDIDKAPSETLEFIHHINTSSFYKIKFIVFTTNTDPEINKQFSLAGAKKMFYKPFNPVDLATVIDNLITN